MARLVCVWRIWGLGLLVCGLVLAMAASAGADITRVMAQAEFKVLSVGEGVTEVAGEALRFPRDAVLMPIQVDVGFLFPDIPSAEDPFAALVQVHDPRNNSTDRPNDFVLNSGAFSPEWLVYEVHCTARQYRELELTTPEPRTVTAGFQVLGALVIWSTAEAPDSLDGARAAVSVRATQQRAGVSTSKEILLKGEYVLSGTASNEFTESKSGAMAVVEPTRIDLEDLMPIVGLKNIRILIFSSELPFEFRARPDEVTRLAGYMSTSVSSARDEVGAIAVFGLPDVAVAAIIDFINNLLGAAGESLVQPKSSSADAAAHPLRIHSPDPAKWPKVPKGDAQGNRLVIR